MTTKDTLRIAERVGAKKGFAVTTVGVRTPDGRRWEIDTLAGGAGFRLYEILSGKSYAERGNDDATLEHDAVDTEAWTATDLVDYLRAVGEKA